MMHSSRPKSRHLLHIFFILTLYSICVTAEREKHICKYDELRKGESNFTEIEEIKTATEPLPTSSVISGEMLSSEEGYTQLRVRVSTQSMDDDTKICKAVRQKVKDAKGNDYQCTRNDLLSDEKKSTIKQIIEKAVEMHTSRLQVKKLKDGFKVPAFTGGFCSRLAIPEEDKTTGISNADLVLYVSAASFKNEPNYAYGFPCAIHKDTKRPLVGGLVIDPKHIDDSDYSTRVLAHEIGHILGFDLDIIEKKKPIEKKTGVRSKPDVNEFRGDKVIEKVKEHYNCADATGMEVEDQKPGSRTPWRGSLWESRNAKDELMAGIVRKGLYTNLTLAFFEDLGLYKADYTNAEHMDWGYKAGCGFLTKKCFENGKTTFPTMFCKEENKEKLFCAADGRTMGTCVGFVTNNGESVADFYNYFGNRQHTGLPYLLTDHCPYFDEKENADCRITEDSDNLPGKQGPNSWCIQINDEKLRNAFDGHNGVCAEKKEDAENGISFTFSDKWKPIICNTEKSDVMKNEYSFRNEKYYCSKPEEIIITKKETDVSDSNKPHTKDGKAKHTPTTNVNVESNTPITQKDGSPIGKTNAENTKSSETLGSTSDSSINEILNNTEKGNQNNNNSAALTKTGATLFFFAALALYL